MDTWVCFQKSAMLKCPTLLQKRAGGDGCEAKGQVSKCISINQWCHDVFYTSIVRIQSVVNTLTSLSFFPQPVTSSIWTLWKQSPWRAPRPLPRQQMPHWVVARVLLPQSSSSKWHHRVSRWPTTSAGKRFPPWILIFRKLFTLILALLSTSVFFQSFLQETLRSEQCDLQQHRSKGQEVGNSEEKDIFVSCSLS